MGLIFVRPVWAGHPPGTSLVTRCGEPIGHASGSCLAPKSAVVLHPDLSQTREISETWFSQGETEVLLPGEEKWMPRRQKVQVPTCLADGHTPSLLGERISRGAETRLRDVQRCALGPTCSRGGAEGAVRLRMDQRLSWHHGEALTGSKAEDGQLTGVVH